MFWRRARRIIAAFSMRQCMKSAFTPQLRARICARASSAPPMPRPRWASSTETPSSAWPSPRATCATPRSSSPSSNTPNTAWCSKSMRSTYARTAWSLSGAPKRSRRSCDPSARKCCLSAERSARESSPMGTCIFVPVGPDTAGEVCFAQRSWLKAAPAAASVASISASPCAADTKPVSYADGAR